MRSAAAPKPRLLAVVAALLVAAGAWAGDPVPDVDVILEQIPGSVIAECSPPNCPDRWVIELTKDFAGAMRPVNLPEGWTFAVDGKQVVLEGPAPDRPTRFRFDAGEAKRPDKISYRAILDGRTLVDTKNLKVTPVAPRQQIGSLQGIVTMPTQVAPGEPMKMRVSEAANLPPGGMWSLSGTVVDEEEGEDPEEASPKEPKRRVALAVPAGQDVPDEALDDIAADQPTAIINTTRSNIRNEVVTARADPDGNVVFDQLPADLQPGSPISMQYVDKFGEMLVDVPSVPDVEVVEPRANGEARITDATPRSFAGQLVCVCGTFPGEAAWNGLLLDGQGAGSPGSASGRMVWLLLPAGLAPGEHVFTGTGAAGFPAADRASTLVLQVGGEIDSSKLQKLETTPMRLWVTGTEEPVDLRVRNLTPGIISIDGGDDQTIRTSGGARNALERSVRGLSPGAFNINYELAGEGCPCESRTGYY